MSSIYLTGHPCTPCPAVRLFRAHYGLSTTGQLSLSYHIEADTERLLIPASHPVAGRRDELWQHTCVEMFVQSPGECTYWEFNFSPSGDWAIYHFDNYRAGMTAPEIGIIPAIEVTVDPDLLRLDVSIDCAALNLRQGPGYTPLASLTAVIETTDQQSSYWAVRHAGNKPDFHHPDSFILRLKTQHSDASEPGIATC